MMQAILLGSRGNPSLSRVYSDTLVQEIAERVSLIPDTFTIEDLDEDPARFRDVRFIFSTWGMPALSEADIARCLPHLEAVFYAAGSVQNFAAPFLSRGVRIFSAWAANAVPVAEFATALIVLSGKGFFQSLRRTKENYGQARGYSESFPGNFGVRVGILGAGMIGSLVIERLKASDLSILVYDPFLSDEQAKALGVHKAGLEEIFSTCQTISNHLANKPEICGLLDSSLFDRMLPNVTFLNTGRGAQVVEPDLFLALEAEPGRTAVLDVTDPEPPVDLDRIRLLDNLFLTPHIAGSIGNEHHRMARYMVEELDRLLKGEPCRYEVTSEMLKTMA